VAPHKRQRSAGASTGTAASPGVMANIGWPWCVCRGRQGAASARRPPPATVGCWVPTAPAPNRASRCPRPLRR
jgi:hypothetical protein